MGSGGSSASAATKASNALAPELEQWQLDYSEIQMRQVIGRGSFGKVGLGP